MSKVELSELDYAFLKGLYYYCHPGDGSSIVALYKTNDDYGSSSCRLRLLASGSLTAELYIHSSALRDLENDRVYGLAELLSHYEDEEADND